MVIVFLLVVFLILHHLDPLYPLMTVTDWQALMAVRLLLLDHRLDKQVLTASGPVRPQQGHVLVGVAAAQILKQATTLVLLLLQLLQVLLLLLLTYRVGVLLHPHGKGERAALVLPVRLGRNVPTVLFNEILARHQAHPDALRVHRRCSMQLTELVE